MKGIDALTETLRFQRIHGSIPGPAPELPSVSLLDTAQPWRDLVNHPAPARPAGEPITLWLDGESLICPCPDCQAPMTVRMWLLVADCWQCGTSLELTAADLLAARPLPQMAPTANSDQERVPAASPTAPSPPAPSSEAAGTAPATAPSISSSPRPISARQLPDTAPQPAAGVISEPTAHVAAPLPVRPLDVPAAPRVPPPAGPLAPPPTVNLTSGSLWERTPAWLVSLLVHLAALILLALLSMPTRDEDPYITLALTADFDSRGGEAGDPFEQTPVMHFDVPPTPEANDPQEQEWRARAAQEAQSLLISPQAREPFLADLSAIKSDLVSEDLHRRSLAARDPRIRQEVIEQEGGTTMTEAAVARGLRWLAQHQHPDGHWSLHEFHHTEGCQGQCDGQGFIDSDSAGTSLCLLPFLGAGQTHLTGKYRDVVSRGLRWLLVNQRRDGDLRGQSHGNAGMYAHGQATIVLCEAFAMSRDETLRRPAEMAVRFILEAQHGAGGWRYSPGERGDTSVLGWQLMALQSARAAGFAVPPENLELANHFLDSVASDNYSRYAYQPGHPPTEVMTAEALLCRFYLGWRKNDPGVVDGVRYILFDHPPSLDEPNIYYWYYATQTLHHFGGRAWKLWNQQMRSVLIESQERHGHLAGSWRPAGPFSQEGGRIYTTALAVCTLEVYYRHAPIFRQIQLD